MSRYVAVEWDNAEARVALARTKGASIQFEQAFTVDLSTLETRSPKAVGTKIRDALKAFNVGRTEALVAVGRANLELRFLTVPPVPAEELADLVRFQASRQFSQPIEEGLLDFSPLAASGDPPTTVLAAAIPTELMKSIRETCEAADLTPKHVVLRPFAAEAIVTSRLNDDSCVLTIDRLAEELDLTVVLGRQAVFPRTVRVSNYGTAEEQAASLTAEVRRTLAAARNHLNGHKVDSVYIFGRRDDHAELAETIRRELELPVECLDPFEDVKSAALDSVLLLPAHTGRFAPLVGMLLTEAAKQRHEIDFLAPRKKPVPPDRRRLYSLAATVVGCAAFAFAFMLYWQLGSLDEEIESLRQESKKLDTLIKAGKPKLEHAKLLEEYARGEVIWLEEMRNIAQKLPPADKVIVRELDVGVGSQGSGGRIQLQSSGVNSTVMPELSAALRDDRRQVSTSGGSNNAEEAKYPWNFRETIHILPAGESTKPPAKGGAK